MIDSRSWPRSRRHLLRLCVLLAMGPSVLAAPAHAASDAATAARESGTWDLAFEKGNRRCRVNLEASPSAAGFALGMPAGCRRAFPALSTVRAWSPGEGNHILFGTEAGQPVVDFGPGGGPGLTATVSENDVYTLTPTDQRKQEALARAVEEAAATPAAAAPAVATSGGKAAAKGKAAVPDPMLKPATPAEVAGNYAVLRLGKDTGCMVTLEPAAKGAKSALKAKLAPACRDQGIVIFDPVGWQITKGQMVLTAKRGHTTILSQHDERTWANAPAKGAALVLKRL
jgi:hypothetical protein